MAYSPHFDHPDNFADSTWPPGKPGHVPVIDDQGRRVWVRPSLPEGFVIALLFSIGFLAGTGTMALLFMVWLAKHFPGLWS
jgi:hypothetical protein